MSQGADSEAPEISETDSEEVAEGSDQGTPVGLDPELLERRDAALAHVVKFGDPILKSRATPVGSFDERLHAEVERMIAIMREGMGVGLAATQVGVLRRVLVFQAGPDASPRAIVNPEVQWLSAEVVTAEEGCLSLPKVSVDVERPLYARVGGHDEIGEPILIEASGLEARVLQHEMDHLDGLLILDRTTRDQRKGALRALRDGGSYHPPSDDDEDGGEADSGENANVPAAGRGGWRRFGRSGAAA